MGGLKILLVGSSLHDWGGIERYLVYLSGALADRGHDVLCTAPPGSPLAQRLKVAQTPISVRGKYRVSSLVAYLRLFKTQQFDVVNAHFSPDFLMPVLAAKMRGLRCRVLTRHLVLPWSASKVRQYTGLFTHFIGVSDAVKKILVESGVPADRVLVAKAGCPELVPTRGREEMRRELGIEGFAAGFFGRLVADKGIETLVAASKVVPSTIHLFGDGPLASQVGQVESLRFHGRVEDVANAMSAMDAILIPSLWEEAFPFAALEAMSLGKPLIVTRSGGLPEMVGDSNGLVIEKGDAAGLAAAVSKFSADSSLVVRFGEGARKRHREEFTIQNFGERVEAAYRACAGL